MVEEAAEGIKAKETEEEVEEITLEASKGTIMDTSSSRPSPIAISVSSAISCIHKMVAIKYTVTVIRQQPNSSTYSEGSIMAKRLHILLGQAHSNYSSLRIFQCNLLRRQQTFNTICCISFKFKNLMSKVIAIRYRLSNSRAK